MRIKLSLLILLLLCSPCLATNYYSSSTGSGSTCSEVSPCTLNTGLTKLTDGDTLYLRGGTYSQSVAITSGGTAGYKTIRNYTGEIPIIDATGNSKGIDISSGVNYIAIIGLEIKNANDWGISTWEGRSNSYITIQNRDIHDNGLIPSLGNYTGGIVINAHGSNTITNLLIDNNTIHHNDRFGVLVYVETGVTSSSNVFSNNLIVHPN